MKCSVQDCRIPATRHAPYEGASWYCDEHGVCMNPECGKSIACMEFYAPTKMWLCVCTIAAMSANAQKTPAPVAGTLSTHAKTPEMVKTPFHSKRQPDWTIYGFVRCSGEIRVSDCDPYDVVWLPEKWARKNNCIQHEGKWISRVGYERLRTGKWRLEVDPVDHLAVSGPLPDKHIAWSADTLPPGVSLEQKIREIDAENVARRGTRGIDLSPCIPEADPVFEGRT